MLANHILAQKVRSVTSFPVSQLLAPELQRCRTNATLLLSDGPKSRKQLGEQPSSSRATRSEMLGVYGTEKVAGLRAASKSHRSAAAQKANQLANLNHSAGPRPTLGRA